MWSNKTPQFIEHATRPWSDPAVPVFFPKVPKLMDVFTGAAKLKKGSTEREPVGLIQQALTDLCVPGGIWGPNKDGVDRKFGDDTVNAVKTFQTSEALPDTGEVDKDTLHCLDETRSKKIVPCKTTVPLTSKDLLIEGQSTGGRDEEIFFARGDKALDAGDKSKIKKLATTHKGKALTLAASKARMKL
jgi:peptidoglycan hydrolase-like protein with peptidoglycan-binding domain